MTWHGHVHAATLALPLAEQCRGRSSWRTLWRVRSRRPVMCPRSCFQARLLFRGAPPVFSSGPPFPHISVVSAQ